VRLALALLLTACGTTTAPFDPDVLTGSVVESGPTEIAIASDFADSASTRVRGVDGIAMGLRPGDRVQVRRLDRSVGKTDPLDWDCRAARACDVRRE
jgi:hypothetical protein